MISSSLPNWGKCFSITIFTLSSHFKSQISFAFYIYFPSRSRTQKWAQTRSNSGVELSDSEPNFCFWWRWCSGSCCRFSSLELRFWFSNPPLLAILLSVNSNFPFLKNNTKMKPSRRRTERRWKRRRNPGRWRNPERRNRVEGDMLMKELKSYRLEFHVDNFCLPALELEHLRLEFYNKTRDAIFLYCLAKSPLTKLLKI